MATENRKKAPTCSDVFARVAKGKRVGSDLWPKMQVTRGQRGASRVPEATALRWGDKGLVNVEREEIGGGTGNGHRRLVIVRVVLTEAGKRAAEEFPG